MRPLVIGISGGIASGKSTVLSRLRELGFVTIDADKLGHEVYSVDSATYRAVVARFGADIVDPMTREIMRPRLAQAVFSDPSALTALERLTHPAILARIQGEIAESALRRRDAAIEAVRLFSSGLAEYCDETWLVSVPAETALERLMRTRALTHAQAWARIEAQRGLFTDAASRADWLIDGALDLPDLWAKIDERVDRLRMNR